MRTGALVEALAGGLRRRVQDACWDLDGVIGALVRAAPDTSELRRGLGRTLEQAATSMRRALDRRHGSVGERYVQLNALSPMNTLTRGYALVRGVDGGAVVAAADVAAGAGIRVTFHDGEIAAEVVGRAARNGHG